MDTITALKQFLTQELLSDRDDLDLADDENLLTSGLVDSLGVMRLIGFIEERFDIQVPPEDVTIDNFRTIKVIAGYIESRTGSLAFS